MPGSSLWLVPAPSSSIHTILSDLISKTLPHDFPDQTGPPFAPHMTLTSDIPPDIYGEDAQKWLDSIPWPSADGVRVQFERVVTGDVFFRRCYIKVAPESVKNIAGLARARGVNGEEVVGTKTEKWLTEWVTSFGPHVSLIYGDTPIGNERLKEITQVVHASGIRFDEESKELTGWDGGVIWLVPTDRPISEWTPIATRQL